MKQKKSLASMSSRKKKSIIIGCAVGGVAMIALSVGLGVGLTQCNVVKEIYILSVNANSIANYGPAYPVILNGQ